MKITMLGVGNGFSPGIYDNNALVYEHPDHCALIDCGNTAWISLDILGRSRQLIDSIFLSHIHFDHAGGVEAAAIYGAYFINKKYRIIAPEPIISQLWDGQLKCAIEKKKEGRTSLDSFFEVVTPKEDEPFTLCEGITARWFRTQHHEGKFSAGLVLNDTLAFTSDMIADQGLVERLVSQGITAIFHDCQMSPSDFHAEYATLLKYPEHLKEKMYLMHHTLRPEQFPQDGLKFLTQHQEMTF